MVQYSDNLDETFTALGDPTRRGILEHLGRGAASISDLGSEFEMSLTGIKKHVRILEEVGLVVTEKTGRVRTCRLGQRRLDAEQAWMDMYHMYLKMLDERLDHLARFLDHTKGEANEHQ